MCTSTTQRVITMSNGLVQYILLRGDLLQGLGWNIGALVTQACHAATAVLHLQKEDPLTQQYLADLDNMHKVVLEDLLSQSRKHIGILGVEVTRDLNFARHIEEKAKVASRKLVILNKVPDEETLKMLSKKLEENAISHKLWIEQPENIVTCIALKPYKKDDVKKFVGKFKLYKREQINK